ncbi:hypothetical protein THAOC_06913, partial [Thalassiosira oceanica]
MVAIFSSLSPLKQSNRSETIFEMFLISMDEDSLTSLETNACSMAPDSSLRTCWQGFDDRTDTSLCVMRLRRNLGADDHRRVAADVPPVREEPLLPDELVHRLGVIAHHFLPLLVRGALRLRGGRRWESPHGKDAEQHVADGGPRVVRDVLGVEVLRHELQKAAQSPHGEVAGVGQEAAVEHREALLDEGIAPERAEGLDAERHAPVHEVLERRSYPLLPAAGGRRIPVLGGGGTVARCTNLGGNSSGAQPDVLFPSISSNSRAGTSMPRKMSWRVWRSPRWGDGASPLSSPSPPPSGPLSPAPAAEGKKCLLIIPQQRRQALDPDLVPRVAERLRQAKEQRPPEHENVALHQVGRLEGAPDSSPPPLAGLRLTAGTLRLVDAASGTIPPASMSESFTRLSSAFVLRSSCGPDTNRSSVLTRSTKCSVRS